MEDTTVFKASEALERVDGDMEFLAELGAIFFQGYPDQWRKLTEAVERGSASELEKTAHSMKSALGNIGAASCAALCANLELLGRQGHAAGLDTEIHTLDREISMFQDQFQKLLSAFTPSSRTTSRL